MSRPDARSEIDKVVKFTIVIGDGPIEKGLTCGRRPFRMFRERLPGHRGILATNIFAAQNFEQYLWIHGIVGETALNGGLGAWLQGSLGKIAP